MEGKKYGLAAGTRKTLDAAQERLLRYSSSQPEGPGDLDLRRQSQIARQIEVINRLLEGESYEGLLRELTESVAELIFVNDQLTRELDAVRGTLGSRGNAFIPRSGSTFTPPRP